MLLTLMCWIVIFLNGSGAQLRTTEGQPVHHDTSVIVFPVLSGTGASCIYPLLGATMNGWFFLATEVDDICFDYATKNVEQNNLSDLVKGERRFFKKTKQSIVCPETTKVGMIHQDELRHGTDAQFVVDI